MSYLRLEVTRLPGFKGSLNEIFTFTVCWQVLFVLVDASCFICRKDPTRCWIGLHLDCETEHVKREVRLSNTKSFQDSLLNNKKYNANKNREVNECTNDNILKLHRCFRPTQLMFVLDLTLNKYFRGYTDVPRIIHEYKSPHFEPFIL